MKPLLKTTGQTSLIWPVNKFVKVSLYIFFNNNVNETNPVSVGISELEWFGIAFVNYTTHSDYTANYGTSMHTWWLLSLIIKAQETVNITSSCVHYRDFFHKVQN